MRLLLVTLWHFARRWPYLIVGYAVSTVVLIGLWVADPLIAQYVIDQIGIYLETGELDRNMFSVLFGTWIAVSLLLSATQAVQKMLCWRTLNRTYLGFQEESYHHILTMDVAQFVSRRAGAIIKKIDNAADQLWDLGFQLFNVILPSTLAGFIFLGIAFFVNVRLSLIVTGILATYGVVLVVMTRKAYPLQNTISHIWVAVIGRAYDVATNALPMKSAAGELRELRRMQYWNRRGLRLQNRTDMLWGTLEGLNMFVLLRAIVVGMGVILIAGNELTLGQLFFFLFIVFRMITPIEVIGGFLPKWNEKISKIQMGVRMGQLQSVVQNPPDGKRLKDIRGEVQFQNVSFSYDQANRLIGTTTDNEEEDEDINILDPRFTEEHDEHLPHHDPLDIPLRQPAQTIRTTKEPQHALQDISLTVRPGEHIAFVGHSGAGKSTMAAILNRFYDVTEGAILIDGVDLRAMDLYWWRSQVGLVLQDNIMFNDTILENIRYARPGATKKEVINAAKRASAHTFIEAMQDEYATQIGERGVRLSGGERQRLAIARAILKLPSLVVLDEATSALDSITEKEVQEGIRELIERRTSFIIAHRLSTVRSVDRIAVLDKGHLIACAPHDELLKTCKIYREMVELQSHGMLAE